MANVQRSIEEELQSAYVLSEQNKGKKKKKSQDLILLESIKKGGSINKDDDDTTLLANLYDPDGDPKNTKNNKQRQRQQLASSANLAFVVDSEDDILPKKPVKQKKHQADLIVRYDSSPATIETENEVLSGKPKKKKKTVIALKNESNTNKTTDALRIANVSAEATDEPPPQPRAKKKIKKLDASQTRVETQSDDELCDENGDVVTEPPKSVKPKPRKTKRKSPVNVVDGATSAATVESEQQLAVDDDKVLQVVIHRTDKLKSDVYVIHPVVRISVVDLETGKAIKKQPRNRRVLPSFFEAETGSENVDFILPIISLPFDLKKNQSLLPIWEETVVFSESFDHLCRPETNVMIFFEVLDFVSMRTTNRRTNNDRQDGGWYHVAWAFLKLVGVNGHPNTGKKVRLQLYKPLRRAVTSRDDQLQVFTWWTNHLQRVAYPSTLYVTVKSMVVPMTQVCSEHPSVLHVDKAVADQPDVSDLAEGGASGGAEPSLWSRFPGQQCRIPNSQFLNLNARRKGCYVLRFSHSGKSLACGCHDRDGYPILIYSIPSGQLVGELQGHYGIVYDLCWSKSDRGLLSASGDGTARVWNVVKMESAACKFLPHPSFVYAAKYHPTVGRVVVTGGFDKVIRVWSLVSDGSHAVLMQEIDHHEGNVNALCFDDQGSKLFSGDGLGHLCVWNVFVSDEETSNGMVKNWSLDKKIAHKDIVGNAINVVQLHPNGRRLLVHTRNNKLVMIDLRVESVLTKYVGALNFREHVRSVLTPCGSFVFAGSEDGQAYVWNTESGDLVSTYSSLGYESTVIDVDYHPHDHMVAFCTYGTSQQVKVFKYDAQAAKREVRKAFGGFLRKDATVQSSTNQTFEKSAVSSATELNVPHAVRLQRVVSKLESVTALQRLFHTPRDAQNTPRSEWLPSAVGDHANHLMSYPGLQPQISITRTGAKAQLTFKDSLLTTEKPLEEVIVLYEYHAQRSDELDLRQGERIKVLYKDTQHWWMGELADGQQGFFPSNYVAEPEPAPKSVTAEKPPSGSRMHAVKTKTGELKFLSESEDSDTDYSVSRKRKGKKSQSPSRGSSIEMSELSRKS